MSNSTENLIKDSFVALLEKKPLSQITVKDICQASNINRNSFYYHFADLPTLVEYMVLQEADQLIAKYPTMDSLQECLNVTVEFALANRTVAMHLYNSNNRDIFEQYFMKITEHVVIKYFDTLVDGKNISDRDKSIIINYYKGLIYGLISEWMINGMNTDIKDDFRRLIEIYSGIPEEIIRRVTQ